MSVSLTTWHGKPALEIADAAGEVWRYLWHVRLGPPWVCELARIDPETGAPDIPYVVREGLPWWCGCKDHFYRRHDCKHIRCARELRVLLNSLQGVVAS